MSQKSNVRPHPFTPDTTLPPVPLETDGRRYCLCGLFGKAGDARHTLPPAPAEDVQRWRAHDVGDP